LLHQTVVGLADRGHQVRVVGAHRADEYDPVERFRLGSSLEVSFDEPGGMFGQAGRIAGAARASVANGRALRSVAASARRAHGLGPRFVRNLAKVLPAFEQRADVVYFEAAYVAAEYNDVLLHLGPKLVMCTGSDVRLLPDLRRRLAETLPAAFAQTARVLCRSEDLKMWAVRRGSPAERTSVLYPAVDTTFFSPPNRPERPGDALRLVSVGRLHWVKGYEYLVEAVSLARGAGVDVTLTIVGADTGAGDAIQYAVREFGLDEYVTLAGAKTPAGVRAALARADAFVLSSLSEGMSRAALEAMAMGLPVVTTDVGGMTEVIEDGVVGLVVPSRDPRALADAVGALARAPERRVEMGHRARALAQQFDTTVHLDRIESILVEVAGYGRT
jgi:colanic acid/amylovoran biosynthesis glycosyltransferase